MLKEKIIKKIKPWIWHIIKVLFNLWINKLNWYNNDRKGWWALEIIDKRDYKFEELAWDINFELPRRVMLSNWDVVNQWNTQLCVAYGSSECANEWANVLWLWKVSSPEKVANWIRTYLDSEIDKRGTYIQYWPKALQQMSKIHSYTSATTLDWVKRALAMWLPISTWTNSFNWTLTWRWAVAVKGSWYWHFISIVWYDDDMTRADYSWRAYTWFLIVENTWGKNWWDNWLYYIPYELFSSLYGWKYALIVDKDKSDEHINKLIKKIDEKKWVSKWNRYLHLVEEEIKKWYEPVFKDLNESVVLNAWEVKTLIELHYLRKKENE